MHVIAIVFSRPY